MGTSSFESWTASRHGSPHSFWSHVQTDARPPDRLVVSAVKGRLTGSELRQRAMSESGTPRRYLALLTRAVRAGDGDALVDFGVLQQEGYRDERGRVLVRANPKAAARAFLQAASAGTRSAAHSLGYCFDVGVGVRRNGRLAMYWYLRAWRNGGETAAANIATIYRDRGLMSRAVAWWTKAMEAGVDEEAVEVGYCHQYGIGVRRNAGKAIACYRRAIRSRNIGEFWREAARYHLAVLYLDSLPPKRAEALTLLERASIDKDYLQAMKLLAQLRSRQPLIPCRCRRGRVKNLSANARCELHRRR